MYRETPAEEETALKAMAAQTFPVAFTLQNVSRLPGALGAAVVLRLLSATADDQDRQAVHRGRKNAGGRKGGFCGAAKCSVPEIVKPLTPFFLLAPPIAGT